MFKKCRIRRNNAEAQFILRDPENCPQHRRDHYLFRVSLNQDDTFCKKDRRTHGVQISFEAANLLFGQAICRLVNLGMITLLREHVHAADSRRRRDVRGMCRHNNLGASCREISEERFLNVSMDVRFRLLDRKEMSHLIG